MFENDNLPTLHRVGRLASIFWAQVIHKSGNAQTHNRITVTQDVNRDVDRPDLGICDYHEIDNTDTPTTPSTPSENPNETTDLSAKITFKGTQELKIGGSTKTLTGSFVDTDGNTTNEIGIWI